MVGNVVLLTNDYLYDICRNMVSYGIKTYENDMLVFDFIMGGGNGDYIVDGVIFALGHLALEISTTTAIIDKNSGVSVEMIGVGNHALCPLVINQTELDRLLADELAGYENPDEGHIDFNFEHVAEFMGEYLTMVTDGICNHLRLDRSKYMVLKVIHQDGQCLVSDGGGILW